MKRIDFFKRLAMLAVAPALIPLIKEDKVSANNPNITPETFGVELELGKKYRVSYNICNYKSGTFESANNPNITPETFGVELELGKKYRVSYNICNYKSGTFEIDTPSVRLIG